jgi:hypothetical protein
MKPKRPTDGFEWLLMKHPARSDFTTVVTEAGVNVTFKPTKSIYCFYRLAGSDAIARALAPSRWLACSTQGAIPATTRPMKFKT